MSDTPAREAMLEALKGLFSDYAMREQVVDIVNSAAKVAGWALVPVEATEKARETLRMAAETFRKYEQLHR